MRPRCVSSSSWRILQGGDTVRPEAAGLRLKMGMGRPGLGFEPGPYGLRAKLWGHRPTQFTICIWPRWPNGHNGSAHPNITYTVNIVSIIQWWWHRPIIIFNSVVNHKQQTLLQEQSGWYWYINNFIQFVYCSVAECHWIACLLSAWRSSCSMRLPLESPHLYVHQYIRKNTMKLLSILLK